MSGVHYWGPQRAYPGVEVIAVADGIHPERAPDGRCRLVWVDTHGRTRLVEVVAWQRLDRGPWMVGQHVTAMVQARCHPDLRLPLWSASCQLRLTLCPTDIADVQVGDMARPQGWRYGARIYGAVPVDTDHPSGASPSPTSPNCGR